MPKKRLSECIDRTPNATPEEQTMFPSLTAYDVRQIVNSDVASGAIIQHFALFTSSGDKERARVLDLGAGNGRNARFLAKKGISVIAVENNPMCIVDLKRLRGELRDIKGAGELIIIEEDFTELNWGYLGFDHAIAINALRFARRGRFGLGRRHIDVLGAMQKATPTGGINVISDLTTDGPLYTGWNSRHESWFSASELSGRYEGWRILHEDNKRVPTIEHDSFGKPLWNQSVTIVAKNMCSGA